MTQVLAYVFLSVAFTSAQKPLECHVPGDCSSTGTTYIEYKNSYLDCHRACRNNGSQCDWFTHYGDATTGSQNCALHVDCAEIYNSEDENVFTGRAICPLVDEPKCHTMGECVDTFPIETTREETYDDCLLACQNNEGCEWLTYHVFSKQCLQYFVCPMVDNNNCTHCYSGQKVCEQAPELDCHVVGEFTQDFPIGQEEAASYDACLKMCQTYDGIGCECFTFYEEWSVCTLHFICRLSNTTCTDCYSGYTECPQETSKIA